MQSTALYVHTWRLNYNNRQTRGIRRRSLQPGASRRREIQTTKSDCIVVGSVALCAVGASAGYRLGDGREQLQLSNKSMRQLPRRLPFAAEEAATTLF